jgi:hypothetical protein
VIGDEVVSLAWIDGATGSVRKVYPARFAPPDVVEWQREGLAAATRVRDSRGRRVWLRRVGEQGKVVLEREGEPAPDRPAATALLDGVLVPVQGGWYGPAWTGREGRVLDADTGEVRAARLPSAHTLHFLSPRRWVRQELQPRRAFPAGSWLVGETTTGEERPAANPPRSVSHAATADRLLALRGEPGAERLVLWDPVAGDDLLLAWEWTAPEGFTGVGCLGRRADLDLHLLMLGYPDGRQRLAVLDPSAGTVRALAYFGGPLQPVALLEDGSLLAITRQERVERIR